MYVKSSILSSNHAFSTRHGGVSTNEHTKSLNLAFFRGDDESTVIKNLEIFAKSINIDPESIISLPQIHSSKVIKADKSLKGYGYYKRSFEEIGIDGCDGYITNDKEITLGVKSADCTPILFEGYKDGKVICIGAVHAGWRGTVGKIASLCAEAMIKEYGVLACDIKACIGPCIHKCCFEVGDDVKDAVYALGDDFIEFCKASESKDEKYFCDLVGINKRLLINIGLQECNIDIIDECTCCLHEKYFSHRYTNGNRGTMLSVISMK